ncbi:MAG: MBL fold metallo-hydrolase [Synergistaceae bacterium]|jgi:7,8-dihydropterin-6-yl-methyl-4-(beta-D-ribofuranosyl)aminobenzene 5'-phosphate synthase|nr:MBL fold metallo-hydrolase [Synergistaceae bacterium]
MIVTVLVENTSISEDLEWEHGLSLYIETCGRALLFDMGGSGLFAKNAEKLGLDVSKAELAIVSHGHSDHGGGLGAFLEINPSAPVYVSRGAFGHYCVLRTSGVMEYAGLNQDFAGESRLVFADRHLKIGKGLELFSDVHGTKWNPRVNDCLYEKTKDSSKSDDFEADAFSPDCFSHEQNLILEENGKTYLFTGCAHAGIVNILERFREIRGAFPDEVIGGFHLSNPLTGEGEDPDTLDAIGRYLLETGARFHTGHCTGAEPYERLKTLLGDRLFPLSTGYRYAGA